MHFLKDLSDQNFGRYHIPAEGVRVKVGNMISVNSSEAITASTAHLYLVWDVTDHEYQHVYSLPTFDPDAKGKNTNTEVSPKIKL